MRDITEEIIALSAVLAFIAGIIAIILAVVAAIVFVIFWAAGTALHMAGVI